MERSGSFFELYYHLDKKGADDTIVLISVHKQVVGESLPTLKRFLYLY